MQKVLTLNKFTDANSLQYTGTVYVFYGVNQKGLNSQPSLTIHGNGTYYNLGTSLLGADIDGDGFKDLIIGSPYAPEGGPQRGSVAVFLAKTQREPGSELSVHDADWLVVGEQDYSWFGYSMTVAKIHGQFILLIGAPTFRYMSFLVRQLHADCSKKSCLLICSIVLSEHLISYMQRHCPIEIMIDETKYLF